MRKITFDVETRNIFQDVGSNDPVALDISLVGIHDSETDELSAYLQEDFPKLWPIIENAEMLITFNGDHFDIPLLNKYYPGDLTKIKSLDIMNEVKKSLGRRIRLDTLSEATLGKKKSGHGLQAIEWWKNGEIEKIKKYCLEDVKITKELYDYAILNHKLFYKDLAVKNMIKEIKLDTSDWEKIEESSLTFTLPF